MILNKVAEYSEMPERIRLRQVNSTLRDDVPPTVPPWHCAFTDDAILDDCDAFWSKIAQIMAWFLVNTHNRVTEGTLDGPEVCFEINRHLQDYSQDRTLQQCFWWQRRVYTPENIEYGMDGWYRSKNIQEEQWMVENDENYYQGCVNQMIQRWRKRLGEELSAKDSADLKGYAICYIRLRLNFGYIGEPFSGITFIRHSDAIKYMGGVIAEKLGRMYGLQVYYYEDYANVGISIAGREPKYHHNIQNISIM